MYQLWRSLFAPALATVLILPALSTRAAPPAKSGETAKTQRSAGIQAGDLDPVLREAMKNAPSASQWPNCNSARLLDLGTATVRSDGTVVATYRLTYKLFNKNARDMAEVRLPYNSSYENLRVISARTIKKDGTVLNVSPEDIRIGGLAGDYLMYDDAMAANFSMPGVEDDCVIDYTWEEITHPTLAGQFTAYWGFSDLIPVGLSRYVLHVPADKPLKYKVYNDPTLRPTVTTSVDGHTKTYTWERKDLKPIEPEPAMPPAEDVKTWVEVSSLDSWQSVAQWFWGLQQPQAKSNAAIKATVDSLIAGKKTEDEKARAIYDWVAGKTRYVGLEFGISAYKPHPASDVFHNLYGDCKDKANLLISMLDLAGIKAYPVLLHAEERNPVESRLPNLGAFNHCIALANIGGKDVWLDATAETCAYGDIPEADRGVQALVINSGSGEFKTIPSYEPAENGLDLVTNIAVQPDGSAHAQAVATMRGDTAQTIRAGVRMLPPDKRKEMAQKIAHNLGLDGNVKDFTLPDGEDKDGPYVLKLTVDIPDFGKKKEHDTLLVLPLVSGMSGAQDSRTNPYSSDTRTWPIVSESTSHLQSQSVLTLPEGYSIEDAPDNLDLVSPLTEYHRKLAHSVDGKTLTITDSFVEHPGKVPAGDYSKVKSFWDTLIKSTGADNEIFLKKKS